MKVKDKIIVVTGAGSGMGRELTIQLVRKGAKVAMADINEKGMKETAEICGSENVSINVLNITEREAVAEFPNTVISQFGQVDGLINNAGIIQPFVEVNQLDLSMIEKVMNINFYGTLYMTKAFLPHLLARPVGHLVNVSSMGGFMPFPKQTIYGSSKAAIKLLTEGLYAELRSTKVSVTLIYPGAVNTNIMSNSGIKSAEDEAKSKSEQAGMALAADKAATIMIDGIERDKYRVLVGKDAKMLDLVYRLAPRRAIHLIVKQMSKLGM
ncbi:MAG: SDR family oxidoreductase [Flavobacteriales bacterium]|nr:SDR family oxidoreductase [Flavobacteriales bacterium]